MVTAILGIGCLGKCMDTVYINPLMVNITKENIQTIINRGKVSTSGNQDRIMMVNGMTMIYRGVVEWSMRMVIYMRVSLIRE